MPDSRKGFTLLEIMIFIAIFSAIVVAMITILVAITRVQTRQVAAAEVNEQSQFLLQQLQYFIEGSSLIDMPPDVSTTTLRLRMPASSTDPTIITLASGTVYLQQGSGAQQPLTSSRVTVSGLTFKKRANSPSHDSVSMNFTVAYNTANVTQKFSQALEFAVARVSAASFDSNIVPSSTNTYSLGNTGSAWTGVNNLIFFNNPSNFVGIGSGYSSPQQTLDVGGGVRINVSSATSTCTATIRGTVWVAQHTSNATDTVLVCLESSDNATYFWAKLF